VALGRWTSDLELAGSIAGRSAITQQTRLIVQTCVSLFSKRSRTG